MEIISKDEAALRGLNYYFTGLPCKHGHIAKRSMINDTCYACRNIYQRGYQSEKRARQKRNINNLKLGKWHFSYYLPPEDFAKLLAFAQGLDIQAGRIPQSGREPEGIYAIPPSSPEPADFSHLPHYGARGPIMPKPLAPPTVSMPWDKGELR